METIIDWRFENLSYWCPEVHGHSFQSPNFVYPISYMHLYPKGIGGQREHLVVRVCGTWFAFSGVFSFYSSDGSLLYSEQQVYAEKATDLVLPPGPKFEDVLSSIRESGDYIILRLRISNSMNWKTRLCTTINISKISVKISPRWITEMKSDETRDFFYIQLTPNDNMDRMWLKIRSKNNVVHFVVEPPTEYQDPFAVEMSLTGSDDTVDRCVKKEHVFRDNSPWTFPEPLEKGELHGKNISLFLCLKTKYFIDGPFHMNCAYNCVSIPPNNTICFSEKEPTTDPLTSNRIEVLTKDSGSQTSLTSDMPDDSVLSKELMCLYQDQDFSDISLKCDNITFPVHRAILSARSPVFKNMFSTDMAEAASNEVDIQDLDPSTLSRFLTYLYTGAVEDELQCESALKLYYAADKYQVPSLKKECAKFLCSNVSVSNVCDVLSLADRHSDDQLTSVAHDFILKNYNQVLSSKEWDSLVNSDSLLVAKTVTYFARKKYVGNTSAL